MNTDSEQQPPLTFGQTIRAYRLGWRWSAKHRALVRLAPPYKGRVQVSLHPAGLVPSSKSSSEYVEWWEDPEILDAIKPLRFIKAVRKPFHFYVDAETGEVVNVR